MSVKTATPGALELCGLIRDVADFPKPGIVFKDITPLLACPVGLSLAVKFLTQPFRDKHIDIAALRKVASQNGPEQRQLGHFPASAEILYLADVHRYAYCHSRPPQKAVHHAMLAMIIPLVW